ncbi:MAG: hypothetical protein ACYSTY_14145 [Planctomycetota bacterium]|jgi:hypothetical protein
MAALTAAGALIALPAMAGNNFDGTLVGSPGGGGHPIGGRTTAACEMEIRDNSKAQISEQGRLLVNIQELFFTGAGSAQPFCTNNAGTTDAIGGVYANVVCDGRAMSIHEVPPVVMARKRV